MNKLLTNGIIIPALLTLTLHAAEMQNPAEIMAHGTEDQMVALLSNPHFDKNEIFTYDDKSGTIFHWAANRGFVKVFEKEHEKYPEQDLNVPNHDSAPHGVAATPFFIACQYGREKVLDCLYNNCPHERLAQPTIKGPHRDWTPLHWIAKGQDDNLMAIPWLITHFPAIDLNSTYSDENIKDFTPLHLAAEFGNTRTVHYLIFLGASPTGMRKDVTQRPAAFARAFHHDDIAHYLQNVAFLTSMLTDLCHDLKNKLDKKDYTDLDKIIAMIKFLMAGGAEIDVEDGLRANTPLHAFIHEPIHNPTLFDCIRWLVEERHAKVNALDLNGNAPLALTCAKGNRLLALYLLNHGADPRIGKNPLAVAMQYQTQEKMFPLFGKILSGPVQ